MDGLLERPDGARLWWDVHPGANATDGEAASTGGASSGATVVLVPPGSRNAAIWPAWFRARCATVAPAVVRLDLRGQGRSTSSPTVPTSVAALVDDVLAVCDVAGVPGPVHLVGAGLGGVVAATAAVARPERVAALTLVATTGWYLDPTLPGVSEPAVVGIVRHERGDPERHRRGVRREVGLLRGRTDRTAPSSGGLLAPTRPDDGLELDAWFDHGMQPGDDHRGVLLRAPALWDDLAGLTVPTVVVHGTRDPLIPVEHGVRLAATIPGAQLLRCEDSGHHLDDALLGAVLTALGVAAGRPPRGTENHDPPTPSH